MKVSTIRQDLMKSLTKTPRTTPEVAARTSARIQQPVGARYAAQVLNGLVKAARVGRRRLAPPERGGQPPWGYYRVPSSNSAA